MFPVHFGYTKGYHPIGCLILLWYLCFYPVAAAKPGMGEGLNPLLIADFMLRSKRYCLTDYYILSGFSSVNNPTLNPVGIRVSLVFSSVLSLCEKKQSI